LTRGRGGGDGGPETGRKGGAPRNLVEKWYYARGGEKEKSKK